MFTKSDPSRYTEAIIIYEPSSTMSSTTNDTELADEWSVVPKIEAKFASIDFTVLTETSGNDKKLSNQQSDFIINNNIKTSTSSNLLTYNYVNKEFTKMYLTHESSNQVQQQTNRNNGNENILQKLVSSLFGPEKLRKEYKQNADFIYLLTTKQLDDNCPLHAQVLITIYRKLTGSTIDCPRYGNHWENIGFQGKNRVVFFY